MKISLPKICLHSALLFMVGNITMHAAPDTLKNSKADYSADSTKHYATPETVIYGANKRKQANVYVPSAITALTAEEIRQQERHGILAKSLEGYTGVDILRSGATDFIVNTRGFNNGLNRRILVLQDGRDAAMPLLGAQEWNSFSLPPEEFASIELVRGPATTLYGANAFNGVLLLRSFAPKEQIGTSISLLAGDYQTWRANIRHADTIGRLGYKVTAGYSHALNFAKRRDSAQFLEYAGLVPERRALTENDRKTFSYATTVRADYDADIATFSAEFGYTRSGNETYVFGLGRTFVPDVERPYLRFAAEGTTWRIQTHWMNRRTLDTMRLLAAAPSAPPTNPLFNPRSANNALWDNSHDIALDASIFDTLSPSLVLSAGGNVQQQYINTEGTSIPNAVTGTFAGVYMQAEWQFHPQWQYIIAARYDYASLHPQQLSPRMAIVFTPIKQHSLRISAGRSFQRPNYSELYRATPAPPPLTPLPNGGFGAPINFAALQQRLLDSLTRWANNTISAPLPELSLARTAPLAYGNSALSVEENIGIEAGYKGVLSDKLFLTVDVYFSNINNFITNFIPGVNREQFPAWNIALPGEWARFDSAAQRFIATALGPNAGGLSVVNGMPHFVLSNTNAGRIRQYGTDVGVNYYLNDEIHLAANYSWYGFQVREEVAGQPLLPNTSPHKITLSAQYNAPSWDIGLQWRYVEGFDWLAGTYRGRVPAYAILNVSGGVKISSSISGGIHIYNLLNREHIQVFGGTFLPRMATVQLRYSL